jgi:flagellar hook-length control protein FliK
MGRKTGRSPVLRAAVEPLGTLGAKQLQQEGKWAQLEVPVVREYQGAAHEATIGSATPVAPVVVVSLEEFRKVPHAINAKVDSADNMVVLSGLSGAMTGTPELMPVDKQNQLQSAIAQEVTYFISKDIQNAEMKLEGLGGAAVEVSINMQGKEAQVVFRSDEVQTREVLENAAAHLKDMLQQEGVVLTGVYVGTSETGESGQQERKFRSGSRSEGMLVIQPSGPGATASLSGVGRTLDLYV